MKRIVLAASLLLSTVMPFATAHAAAAPAAAEAKQSLVEYLGSFESGGVIYDVYLVTDFGDGVY